MNRNPRALVLLNITAHSAAWMFAWASFVAAGDYVRVFAYVVLVIALRVPAAFAYDHWGARLRHHARAAMAVVTTGGLLCALLMLFLGRDSEGVDVALLLVLLSVCDPAALLPVHVATLEATQQRIAHALLPGAGTRASDDADADADGESGAFMAYESVHTSVGSARTAGALVGAFCFTAAFIQNAFTPTYIAIGCFLTLAQLPLVPLRTIRAPNIADRPVVSAVADATDEDFTVDGANEGAQSALPPESECFGVARMTAQSVRTTAARLRDTRIGPAVLADACAAFSGAAALSTWVYQANNMYERLYPTAALAWVMNTVTVVVLCVALVVPRSCANEIGAHDREIVARALNTREGMPVDAAIRFMQRLNGHATLLIFATIVSATLDIAIVSETPAHMLVSVLVAVASMQVDHLSLQALLLENTAVAHTHTEAAMFYAVATSRSVAQTLGFAMAWYWRDVLHATVYPFALLPALALNARMGIGAISDWRAHQQ